MIRSSDHPVIRSSIVWGITDGSAGMEAQVKALAAALGVTPVMKKVMLKEPWNFLPNLVPVMLRTGLPHIMGSGSDALIPPWPDLVISCGRRGALVAIGLRTSLRGAGATKQSIAGSPRPDGLAMTEFIHIQDPQVSPNYFDLVVAMEHDKITGPNVLKTRFALHGITPQTLEEAKRRFAPRFISYPKPMAAVLIGGSTNKYTLHADAMGQVIAALQSLLTHTSYSLLITPSRRTGEENIAALQEACAGNQRIYLYDGKSENPYLGLLALADTIIVTNDSVNMMSEACATGKPVYILPLPGHADTKPARFADRLMREGMTRPLGDKLERWPYAVQNEMTALAQHIRTRLARYKEGAV